MLENNFAHISFVVDVISSLPLSEFAHNNSALPWLNARNVGKIPTKVTFSNCLNKPLTACVSYTTLCTAQNT